ncbi:MAG: Na+/Pi symporter [Piccolia ochrophora]|nr:MAG: Na+/Pi symporter [Piccolia ochrophora]
MQLHQFDYIFALGLIFAFLDAWNIGANDVANSFATSVSSRSLTLRQAMCIASVMEFLGAVLVGSRVADTIRNKILSVSNFEAEPSVLMFGMLCALIGSSTWLTIATKIGLPVSTTHCIVGGIIGVGVAALGAEGVVWGWKGVAQIFAAWFIAPGISAAFAAIIFSLTKYLVFKAKNPLRAGLLMIPVYFGVTSGILTMVIVWKGAPKLNVSTWSTGQVVGCIFGVAFGVVLLCFVFFIPFLHRKLAKDDWTLRWYEIFYGPLLFRRGPVPPPPEGSEAKAVQDYYRGHKTKEELEAALEPSRNDHVMATEKHEKHEKHEKDANASNAETTDITPVESPTRPEPSALAAAEEKALGPWYKPTNLLRTLKWAFFRGVDQDVVSSQARNKVGALSGNLEHMHANTPHYDNKTEHLYSFLQVLTAATASFAHGSNDVSNAMGPLSAIYLIWNSGALSSKSEVPIWVLIYGGAAIVIGLWTYGYHIMRNLGNRLTLHSPSRGFSMELGAAITVVLATRLALPISTTQCIVGATVGVGLCTGTLKSINWRMVSWIYFGWIVTLPVAGLISGCLMGFVINAPSWGNAL